MYISGEIQGHAGAVREENFPGTDEVPVAIGLFPISTAQATPTPVDTTVAR
jgi:hypothetical protein